MRVIVTGRGIFRDFPEEGALVTLLRRKISRATDPRRDGSAVACVPAISRTAALPPSLAHAYVMRSQRWLPGYTIATMGKHGEQIGVSSSGLPMLTIQTIFFFLLNLENPPRGESPRRSATAFLSVRPRVFPPRRVPRAYFTKTIRRFRNAPRNDADFRGRMRNAKVSSSLPRKKSNLSPGEIRPVGWPPRKSFLV